jgi:L,D-peptidoglycan transpeptidase YkuD (ErfK/YbiS/YcfS/YnhG family)
METRLLNAAKQAVIAVAETWESVEGKLFLSERGSEGRWVSTGPAIDIAFGVRGLVWAEDKIEGDAKSPAGIFKIGPVYGKGASRGSFAIEYREITPGMEAVDDPNSLYYNQIVDRALSSSPDWRSSEKMQEIDLYDLMLVIQHNWPDPVPGRGSAIFMHRWRGKGEGTAGCIAMEYNDLRNILTWLDPGAAPVLVLLPRKNASDLLKIEFIK